MSKSIRKIATAWKEVRSILDTLNQEIWSKRVLDEIHALLDAIASKVGEALELKLDTESASAFFGKLEQYGLPSNAVTAAETLERLGSQAFYDDDDDADDKLSEAEEARIELLGLLKHFVEKNEGKP